MKLSMLILVAVIFLAVLCLLPAFFRWRRHQRELKKKLLSRLSNRSDRLLYSLEMISDRYMARDTKIFLIEYLLSVITQLVTSNYKSEFVSKQADLLRLLTELKLGRQVTAKDRVVSQEQLDQIQNSLQFMLRELRSMGESYGASRVIIRHHIVLIRYAHALAYRDLLVRQARLDLDNDRKNRALEKYRIALSVMEKNASVSSSKREMARLQSMIQEVEKVLFSKNNKAELK
ncbi:hypothetical protein SAMN02745753_03551 [Marinomonas polaris DSM 16579]|uniref:5-bromo-4-chloroindolyl phosphate hydrolysis protein n=1 Tax=Marinomonas polaris DSM 16579 TaxID=1122206 RepID=A0A1M5I838_9GAMM|nr:hypothetical protein [Marinomonas polaris]SHG24391.1 hypothetical protein SAMN02745753_03551 [Marinomonas polaris DSM 16579]